MTFKDLIKEAHEIAQLRENQNSDLIEHLLEKLLQDITGVGQMSNEEIANRIKIILSKF